MKIFLPLCLSLLLPEAAPMEAPKPSRLLGEEEVCDFQENECLTPQIFLVDGEDSVPLPANTVSIDSSTNNRVTFSITQTFGSPSWMMASYIRPSDSFGTMKCDEEVIAPAAGTSMTYTAKCSGGKAAVDFYVHDSSYVNATETNNCFADGAIWGDGSNVAMYKMELSCGGQPICGDQLAPPELDFEPSDDPAALKYPCQHPKNTARYSLIVKGDAFVTALEIWGSLSIGGLFTSGNGLGNRLRIGTVTEWRSYVFQIIGKCDMDFVGTVKPYQEQGKVRRSTSWARWIWLAETLESHTSGDKTVVVLTSGGIYSIDDICTGCVKEGHNILVVFNTDEEVEIVGAPDKPFEASIIAPRAHVKLNGSAVYVSGYIVAASFETVGENQEDLIIKGETYNGPLDCGPTDAPTFAPTKEDKIDNTCLANNILLVNDQDMDQYKLPYGTLSVAALDPGSPDFNKTVTFSITQTWAKKLDWMNVAYEQEAGDMQCNDADYVNNFRRDQIKTYTANCNADGIASVEIFAYASLFQETGISNYRNCSTWTESGTHHRVSRYVFDLSCDGRQICTYTPPPTGDEDEEEDDIIEGLCKFPGRTKDLSVITKGDADISASEIFSGVAIGGSLKNTNGNKVEIATKAKKWSYFLTLEDACEIYFKHHVREYQPYNKWLDFSRFEWLTQNLYNMDRDGRRVIVLQSGGDIDLSVYNPDCDSKQSGRNFLLVFNTTEDVNLVGSADSCPYLASVLAPFSHVTLMDDAIYIDGFVVANTFETEGDFEASLRIRGNGFKGDLLCWETEAPTATPSSRPTSSPTTKAFSATPSSRPTFSPTTKAFSTPPSSRPTSSPTTKASSATPTSGPTSTNSNQITVNDTPDDNKAGSNGDPHFRTWKKQHFEYHGQCDMILAKDDKFADGLGLEVQIRTKLVRFWSYIKSAAIRIGDDILEVQGNAEPENGIAQYWINFEYQGPLTSIGGFPITLKMRSPKKRNFLIDLGSKFPGQKIEISVYREFIKVDFINPSEASFGNAVGMLGDWKTGNLLGRDGTTEVHDYYEFGAQWQVRPYEPMLFYRAEDPQFPKACVIPEDPQGERRRRLDEHSVTMEQAEAACAALNDPLDRKDCVYDILATQDLDMAGAF